MSAISVFTIFMGHEGGTKFYEIVRIENQSAGQFVVVRRWGEMTDSYGGGQIKVETYSTSGLAAAANHKVIMEKSSRGYQRSVLSHGFHVKVGEYDTADKFVNELKKHYHHVNGAGAIIGALRLDGDETIDFDATNTAKVPTHEPPPEPPRVPRNEDWGSW